MKLKCVTLENNVNYIIVSESKKDDTTYIYLVSELDSNDFCIRKVINNNGQNYLTPLDSEQEFNYALSLFEKN